MSKKQRRYFTKEQKDDAVRLVRVSGQGIPTVALNLGLCLETADQRSPILNTAKSHSTSTSVHASGTANGTW